jgi:hypothetical protein
LPVASKKKSQTHLFFDIAGRLDVSQGGLAFQALKPGLADMDDDAL